MPFLERNKVGDPHIYSHLKCLKSPTSVSGWHATLFFSAASPAGVAPYPYIDPMATKTTARSEELSETIREKTEAASSGLGFKKISGLQISHSTVWKTVEDIEKHPRACPALAVTRRADAKRNPNINQIKHQEPHCNCEEVEASWFGDALM